MASLSADRPSEVVLAARVARQFYLEGVSKVDIADRLGISRFRVARLLDSARESGLVRIEIGLPGGALDAGLSAELCSVFGLRQAFVFNFPSDGSSLRQRLGDRAEILPGHPLVGRRAQQIGRVEGRDRADLAAAGVVVEPFAAGAHDAFAGCQQGLGRRIAERHQHVRVHQFDLTLDERQADLGLLRRRGAVAGRSPRNHIGDVGRLTIQPDRGHHAVEQFAGTTDERQPLDVLVAAGRFTDEHHPRLRIAVGEHQLRCGRSQRAAVELVEQRAQRFQCRRGARGLARRGDRRIGRGRRFGATGDVHIQRRAGVGDDVAAHGSIWAAARADD